MTQIAELTTQLMPGGRQTKKYTPERVQQIRNLVERGKSLEEIAELVGVTVGTLRVTCSKLGVSLRRPIFGTGTSLPRRGRLRSSNGTAVASRGSSVPLQSTKERPKHPSRLELVEQAPDPTLSEAMGAAHPSVPDVSEEALRPHEVQVELQQLRARVQALEQALRTASRVLQPYLPGNGR
jgi:hypothetical protein